MTNKASDRAKSRNRNGGKFADEVRKPSRRPLGDIVQETGIMSDEDRHALNQTRICEHFAAELSQAATDGHLDVGFPAGIRNYGGTNVRRVDGDVELGAVVHYFDIANQNQAPRRVIAKRITDAKYGWGKGDFILQDVETGDISDSDLRQDGWTFVEKEVASQYLDEYGNRYGYCNDCGEEAMLDSECCINGEVVPYDDDIDTNL